MANGLRKMRKVTEVNGRKLTKPVFKCDNCGCMRYSPCTCMRKNKAE